MSDPKNLLQIATEIVDPNTGKPKIFCDFCSVTFGRMANLYSHLRKFHDLPVISKSTQICGLCNKRVRTITLLQEHMQTEHSITLKFEDKTFYSKKEFMDWKTKIEKETLSSFSLRNTSSEKDKGTSISYYLCHRSGQCRNKQNRVRKMKAFGSVKTGSTCPAIMKVNTKTIDEVSEITVQYQSVHIGHDLETHTIRFTKEERANLASCLKLGMSMDKILEKAKQNSSPTNRYSFLTRKHLHNICRDYGIKLDIPKTKKVRKPQDNNVESNDSSMDVVDYLEIEISNSEVIQENERVQENEEIQRNEIEVNEQIQEHEKNAAVSSLLQLQNSNYSEDFKNRKVQIVNQIKELQLRIETWDSTCPLPEVEVHISALNALLDISASSNPNLHLDGTLAVLSKTPNNKPVTKRKKLTSAKKGSKKTQHSTNLLK